MQGALTHSQLGLILPAEQGDLAFQWLLEVLPHWHIAHSFSPDLHPSLPHTPHVTYILCCLPRDTLRFVSLFQQADSLCCSECTLMPTKLVSVGPKLSHGQQKEKQKIHLALLIQTIQYSSCLTTIFSIKDTLSYSCPIMLWLVTTLLKTCIYSGGQTFLLLFPLWKYISQCCLNTSHDCITSFWKCPHRKPINSLMINDFSLRETYLRWEWFKVVERPEFMCRLKPKLVLHTSYFILWLHRS